MTNTPNTSQSHLNIVEALRLPSAYPGESTSTVEVVETHISWVFLTKKYAYKVKKPISNEFLDYSTLEQRKHLCHEELRLDSRYAPDLYLAVVPITLAHEAIEVDGAGEPCEYAVKLHRFPADALFSQRLAQHDVQPCEIKDLSKRIAKFHGSAPSALANSPYGDPATILREALENLDALEAAQCNSQSELQALAELRNWTHQDFQANERQFIQRKQNGSIRECHGDLHAGNVVFWKGQFTPFDGIEFNASFRWIDVLSDVAFLAMDLLVREHRELSSLLVSSYLEATGDYFSLELLRWYLVYRALVRAKVAAIVMSQHSENSEPFVAAHRERANLLSVATKLVQSSSPTLWITHGLSGSGKSTGAEVIVQREGAIRIRADVERKRLLGQRTDSRPTQAEARQLYSHIMTERTYDLLHNLAGRIVKAGYSAVVDATFLKHAQRDQFARLAGELNVPFRILEFQADIETLRKRIMARQTQDSDPSDADLGVLNLQNQTQEPLNETEREQMDSSFRAT